MNTATQQQPTTRPQPRNIHEIKEEKQQKVNQLITDVKMFFAFSNEQFDKNKTPLAEGEKYVSIGAGAYLPKSQVENYIKGLQEIGKWYKAEVKHNNAKRQNIVYELANYECYYTGDISDALTALGAGYTAKEVLKVYNEERKNHLND